VGTPLGDGLSDALLTLLASTQLQVVPKPPAPPLTVSQQNSAITGVTNLVQPQLALLDEPLTDLFEALGLTLGGADITIGGLWPHQPALAR